MSELPPPVGGGDVSVVACGDGFVFGKSTPKKRNMALPDGVLRWFRDGKLKKYLADNVEIAKLFCEKKLYIEKKV